ncbi:MAG TPA: amidohydrolase family protein [Acetobacteraceae bacterium]
MRRVIDLECDLPPDENGKPRKQEGAAHPPGYGDPERLEPLPGHGFSNYQRIFSRRGEAAEAPGPDTPHGMSIADFVGLMDRAGVQVGVLRASNGMIADILASFPKRFIGLASISPHDGMRGVRELVRLVKERGFGALRVSSLYNMLPASDRRYYPLYAKCVELDIPVRIYASMNYANDRAYDLGHPRHIDQIAVDFPELRIIAGLGGWPWVNEMVALLRRHPNLYCDTASHRPRYFGVRGSGWEQFLQFGNTLLQDKIMVGLSWEAFGVPMEALIEEYAALPLKGPVLDKWLFGNARNFFRLATL